MGDIIIKFGDNEASLESVRPQRGWLCECGQRGVEMGGGMALPRSVSNAFAIACNCGFTRGSRHFACNTEVFLKKAQETPKRKRAFHQAPMAQLPLSKKDRKHQSFSLEKRKK